VKTLSRIVTVLLVEAIVLCIAASYFLIYDPSSAQSPIVQARIESTVTLLIFNFIFISLFFQFNAALNLKLALLAVGNFTGLCWNFIFNSFVIAGTALYGGTFNRFCLIFFPFLGSLWIISFWSLSLTLVHRNRFFKEL
jgi:hypothetical protein